MWRDEKGAGSGERSTPVVVEGTVLLDLSCDLPLLLPQRWRRGPTRNRRPARPIKLLIARSVHGRVAVARSTDTVERMLALADGRRTLRDLARETGADPAQVEEILRGLVELGAVRFSTGS